MSEAIRQIQLKRTKKGQQDENISALVLNYGEPVVNTETGYMVVGDGSKTYGELKTFLAHGVPIPKVTNKSFPYINANISPIITEYFPDYCTLSGDLSAKNVGSYTITASLKKDENEKPICSWSDGTFKDKVITWSITQYIQGTAQECNLAKQAAELQAKPLIDGIKFTGKQDINHYAICSTASTLAAKSVTLDGFDFALVTGAFLRIKFTDSNSSGTPTLNVNNTGAKQLLLPDGTIFNTWQANELLDVVYDGKNYVIDGSARATESQAGIVKLNNTPGSKSKTDAATPYLVDLKCRCYVQGTQPSGNINKGDLFIDSNTGAMYYYDGSWKPVHNVWA